MANRRERRRAGRPVPVPGTEGMLTELTEAIRALVTQMIEAGGKFPIRMVTLGANGTLLYGRLDGADADQVLLAEYLVDGFVAVPINLLFVDADGNGLRAVFEIDQDTFATRVLH